MSDPIYVAPAPLMDEQYAELAHAMGIDTTPTDPQASAPGETTGASK